VLLTLTAAGAVGGCGLQSGGGGASGATVTSPSQSHKTKAPAANLPPRPAGEVGLEGSVNGSINQQALHEFAATRRQQGLAIRVVPTETPAASAFADLCGGTTDVVATASTISQQQLEACRRNGLTVLDLPTVFDAVVVASRNEADVGADCLSVDQLRAAFEAGSRVDSWTQLSSNFRPITLRPVGRRPPASEFDIFVQDLFGVANPSLSDVRADYKSFPTEDGVRLAIWKHPPGRIGIFRFTYYQVFEEQLRPLEVNAQTGEGCIFPSPDTVSSGLYPLGQTFHLYTTDRSVARQEVSQFLTDYLRSAPKLGAQADLIPLSTEKLHQEIRRIDAVSTKTASQESSGSG
jgi:ABC-type phosphate transport system substrate-binding protein